jgi:hypothetical protein
MKKIIDMKKEDAGKILEFLEYVGKNMPVKDENFEYHRDTLFDCKYILNEELNSEVVGDKKIDVSV